MKTNYACLAAEADQKLLYFRQCRVISQNDTNSLSIQQMTTHTHFLFMLSKGPVILGMFCLRRSAVCQAGRLERPWCFPVGSSPPLTAG